MASILLVCTGNICRTPIAEGFLKEHLRLRFPGQEIDVSSAGVIAVDGNPATAEAVHVAGEREADISSHRARRLRRELIEAADLVIGMSGEHRDEIVRLAPQAAARTFTLKELHQLLRRLPPVRGGERLDGDAFRSRVAEANALRDRDPLVGFDLDVADPLGMPVNTYRATAWELDSLLSEVVEALVGKQPARTSMWGDE